MSTVTRSELQELYERAAREFSRRLLERFGKSVHAVVLYGSVARGAADEDSDIDVLVLSSDGAPDRDQMIEISESIDFENGYRTFLIATGMTPGKLTDLSRGGFPIAQAIFTEGVALYDDGTFERIRENSVGEGRQDAV
jgi:predicted nucleotidyltransferase